MSFRLMIDEQQQRYSYAAKKLESIDAEGLIICANVMYKVSNAVAAVVNVPVLHVVDAVGPKLKANGIRKVALLATKC